MKKLILLVSLMTLFMVLAVPALAQEVEPQPDATADQYQPGGLGSPTTAAEAAAEDAIEDIIGEGGEADGAAAYEAALNAAREAGVDNKTAEMVATEVVADVSEEPGASEEPEITELPDTGGAWAFALGAGLLIVGAGLLTRRLF